MHSTSVRLDIPTETAFKAYADYAFIQAGVEMFKLYESNMTAVRAGDFSLLADVHAFSSALKSYTTIAAASAIEDCRRACGGHGYSMAGGMASQYQDYLPQVTYEGDSYMLTQQVAKYLMTTFRKLSATDFQNLPAGSHITSTYIAGYLVRASKMPSEPRIQQAG
jgi:acyl-CoA oxidase